MRDVVPGAQQTQTLELVQSSEELTVCMVDELAAGFELKNARQVPF